MIIREESYGKRVILFPGEYYVTDRKLRISTLLGSCISACLYDPVNRVVGMNHFLLSGRLYAGDRVPIVMTEAGRYGVHAMELIINGMLKLGAQKKHLNAKVCGGSSLNTSGDTVRNPSGIGEINCRFIEEFLRNEGIRTVSSDLGGEAGRVVHFDSHDYSMYVRRIKKVPLTGLGVRDNEYFKKELSKHRQKSTEPIIF